MLISFAHSAVSGPHGANAVNTVFAGEFSSPQYNAPRQSHSS
jgi:hypothetical protein